jgi:hypothetical protein
MTGPRGGRRVFISYSRADSRLASYIVRALEDRGHDPWIDVEEITSGSWAASIVEAIRQSDVVVVLLTSNSVQSKEVIKEVRLAAKRHAPIIPVVTSPPPQIPPDIEYHTVGEQRIAIDPESPMVGLSALIRAVEGSSTQSERRTRRSVAGCLATLAVLGVVVFGVATVVAGRIPPWATAPECESVTATVQSAEAASFVNLRGAVIDIVFRNRSDRSAGLPGSGDVTVTGADGFQYQHDSRLVSGGRAWFLSESVAPGSTKSLKLGVASEASRPRNDTVTIRVPNVSDLPIPVLRCEVTVRDVPIRFAR